MQQSGAWWSPASTTPRGSPRVHWLKNAMLSLMRDADSVVKGRRRSCRAAWAWPSTEAGVVDAMVTKPVPLPGRRRDGWAGHRRNRVHGRRWPQQVP